MNNLRDYIVFFLGWFYESSDMRFIEKKAGFIQSACFDVGLVVDYGSILVNVKVRLWRCEGVWGWSVGVRVSVATVIMFSSSLKELSRRLWLQICSKNDLKITNGIYNLFSFKDWFQEENRYAFNSSESSYQYKG